MKSVLVVGHGLAGAILTQSLLQKGFHVQCMDADIQYSASCIAAGLINPFIGPKLNQPEDFDQCIQANSSFFKNWERETGEQLLKKENLIRVFTCEKQGKRWEELSRISSHAHSFLSPGKLNNLGISGKWGAGKTHAYRINIRRFLTQSKERLVSMGCWINPKMEEIHPKADKVIIFAEGFNVIENPFFNWLPFAPAQGEILELHGPAFPAISNGTWLLPNNYTNYLTGSTWKHSDLKSGPTPQGKNEIFGNLNFVPVEQFKQLNHFSGIRSGTKDRNPIIGRHPKYNNLFIFNGFGSRGSTTIKLNADRLIDLLKQDIELPQNINLTRFRDYYHDS